MIDTFYNGTGEKMARKIVITSGKGGAGKTTVCANLAVWLSKKGERVILCDADFGLNNLDLTLGVENAVQYDIVDVVEGRCRAKQALVRHPTYVNLYILSGAHTTPERYISPQALKLVLDAYSDEFDYILVDCPSGIDEGFHRAVAPCDEAIVVTTPHLASIRDADKVLNVLRSYHLKSVSLVVNRVRGDWIRKGKSFLPQEIAELMKVELIGVLPEADEINFYGQGESGKAFKLLAQNVMTGKRKIYEVDQTVDFWQEVSRFLKGG